MQKIKDFLAQYSTTTHAIAVFVGFLVGGYFKVPVFHDYVNSVYNATPDWLQKLVEVSIALYVLYRKGNPTSAPVQTKLGVLVFLLLLCSLPAHAQTGLIPGVETTADAVHYRGAWTLGTTEYVNFDLKDSTPDLNGYVNSLYVGGLTRIYTGAGFTTYGGYTEYVPTKALAYVVKTTNIPIDSFRIYVRGGVGETVPNHGSNFVTGFAGAGASIAITSSGSVVWNTVYAEWQNPGVLIVKSGFTFNFTGTPLSTKQSKVAAQYRRLALR